MTEPHARFRQAYDAAQLSVPELWLRYFALGGVASELEVDAYLNGAITLPAFQHDMLAHAINERLDEITPPSAPYSEEYTAIDHLGHHLSNGDQGDPQ